MSSWRRYANEPPMSHASQLSLVAYLALATSCGGTHGTTTEDAGVLGRIMTLTGRLAKEQGSPEGYRTIVNTGRIGRQDVMHVHVHVVGGPNPLGRMVTPG